MTQQRFLPEEKQENTPGCPSNGQAAPFDEGHELSRTTRIIAVAIAIVVALVCVFPVANWLSSPETHGTTIAALEQKAQTVTGMVGASAAASTAITVLPGDVGTPIADKLVDLSGDFVVVLGTIYLEKYLLTLLCLVAFRILMPLACLCFVAWVLLPESSQRRETAKNLCAKLALFALAAAIVVPASVYASGMIEDTYAQDTQVALSQATDAAQQAQQENGSSTEQAQSSENGSSSAENSSDGGQSSGFLDDIKSFIGNAYSSASSAVENATNTLTQGVQDALTQAQEAFNKLVETLAVMVIVNCVIPILVLVFFIWLVNLILGTNFRLPSKPFGKTTDDAKRRMHGE